MLFIFSILMLFQTANIFRLGDQLYLQWDAQAEDIFFQVQADDSSWTGTNTNMYAIPKQPLGEHTIRIRACNVEICSESIDITFRIVPRTTPRKPENVIVRP